MNNHTERRLYNNLHILGENKMRRETVINSRKVARSSNNAK